MDPAKPIAVAHGEFVAIVGPAGRGKSTRCAVSMEDRIENIAIDLMIGGATRTDARTRAAKPMNLAKACEEICTLLPAQIAIALYRLSIWRGGFASAQSHLLKIGVLLYPEAIGSGARP